MPDLQQVSTQETAPLDSSVDPLSSQFAQNRVSRYQAQTQPAANEGLRSLRSYIRSSRGLADSGIEGAEVGGLAQSRERQIGDYAGQVGEDQANMAERNKVRQQQRGWQKEDQAYEEHQRALAADRAKQSEQDKMWGTIMGGVGGIAGNLIFPGIGGMIGSKLGDLAPPPSGPGTGIDEANAMPLPDTWDNYEQDAYDAGRMGSREARPYGGYR